MAKIITSMAVLMPYIKEIKIYILTIAKSLYSLDTSASKKIVWPKETNKQKKDRKKERNNCSYPENPDNLIGHRIVIHCGFVHQSSVAQIFHHNLVLLMGECDHCSKLSPAHPKDSQLGQALDSVEANPRVYKLEPDESWPYHPGICLYY